MKRTDLNSQTAREAFDRLHPQPVREGMPEKLEVHSTGLLPMKAEIHPINDPDGLIILADVQTMELATEICKRYNAFPGMYEALKIAENYVQHFKDNGGTGEVDKDLAKIRSILNSIKL